MKQRIIKYLTEKYAPRAILLYGSYACGMNDETSDFDCVVIADGKPCEHDSEVIQGVPLDCFIYTPSEAEALPPDTFLPVWDAEAALDDGTGAALMKRVRAYIDENSRTSPEDKAFLRGWIEKTIIRMGKGDTEGGFRAFMLMSESLEDYCSLRDRFYFGSKKTAAYLREYDTEGFELFTKAVNERTDAAIVEWMEYVIRE